jgi:hypothetical protein
MKRIRTNTRLPRFARNDGFEGVLRRPPPHPVDISGLPHAEGGGGGRGVRAEGVGVCAEGGFYCSSGLNWVVKPAWVRMGEPYKYARITPTKA